MFIATGAVTINPAFLREIKEDNRELRHWLQRSAAAARAAAIAGEPSRELVAVLGQLRDQLALHFALEEAYGYFDNALVDAPELSRRALGLRDEHEPLYRELCQIVEQAERWHYRELAPGRQPLLDRRFEDFRGKLDRHEQAENELIRAAYCEQRARRDGAAER